MSEVRDIAPPSDDFSLLQELLTAPPPPRHTPLRPAQLRSISQERKVALKGYRFRGMLDQVLYRIERVLMVILIGFFGYWLYDGYGRDMWYAWHNPPAPQVEWHEIRAGASAAELQQALGASLPYSKPDQAPAEPQAAPGAPQAQAPDYLVPAAAFIIPPPTPTPDPALLPTAIPLNLMPLQILIPAMQLNSPVREVFLRDGIWEVADYAVGYHNGTAYPGRGNTVLAGHAGFRGGVFARLSDLKPGDDVYIQTEQIQFHYQVQTVQNVWPNQVEVMYPTAESVITMITCTSFDTQRLVVRAVLVDQAPLSPSGGGGELREAS